MSYGILNRALRVKHEDLTGRLAGKNAQRLRQIEKRPDEAWKVQGKIKSHIETATGAATAKDMR